MATVYMHINKTITKSIFDMFGRMVVSRFCLCAVLLICWSAGEIFLNPNSVRANLWAKKEKRSYKVKSIGETLSAGFLNSYISCYFCPFSSILKSIRPTVYNKLKCVGNPFTFIGMLRILVNFYNLH